MQIEIPKKSYAVVMHERGGPDVLKYEVVDTPDPLPDEVLIRVHAATVNHTDLFHRTGQFFIQKDLPHVLGMDVAGEIVRLGDNVSDWAVGDRVVATFEALGRERNGAYSEYATLPVNELHRIPDGLSYTNAASIGLAFTTAWIALFYAGDLRADDRVLIHAASSGVGTAAVQIASWVGAQCFAITSPAKAESLRTLGADFILERTEADLIEIVDKVTEGQNASLVLDLVGKPTLQQSIQLVGRNGRVVCVGALGGEVAEINVMDLIMKNATIRGSFDTVRPEDFDTILRLFADGTFKPAIDSVLPLSDARRAHERIEAKMVSGKIILVPELNRRKH
ncbi:MAG: zinc-binding dehydrogenase [Bdellovibrionales bacterium]|nr:zinc-binding dehydrogenase [Bdellovibrionales bacterium]